MMITEERLQEIERAPREANIFKAEAHELVAAYRNSVPGLTVTNDSDGVWLHIKAASGKVGSLNMEALGIQRGGIVGQALIEWADALSATAAP
jgi:hypothetical protein